MSEGADPRQRGVLAAAALLSVPLEIGGADRLLRYLDLLHRWNATYNLTAVRDPQEMLAQHLFDCLAVVAPLCRARANGGRILDVGSGGGLPGAVIAVVCPQFDVTCVDTVGKKAAFIRQAAATLGLPNLHAQHARVEQFEAPLFDVITSRAFASLADFVRLTRRHLAPGGVWMAMKGKHPDAEMAALPPNIEMFHVEPLRVPDLAAERCLVWMKFK